VQPWDFGAGAAEHILFWGAKLKKKVYRSLLETQTASGIACSDFSYFEKLFKIYKNTDIQLCIDHLIS
jgi:hypothetical protein